MTNGDSAAAILTAGGNNASTTFSGVIDDGTHTTGLTKIGTGALTLSGTNTYSGATTVDGGTLEVDGSIADSTSVLVNSGGTLSGIGTVDPVTTTIAGTLAPGNAANPTGTLTITGNLAFQSGALYLVQVTPANAGSVSVSGTATLTGATVNAQFAAGSYLVKQYTILTASGGLGGTSFANLTNTNLPAGFTDSLSYNADDVFLNLTAGLGAGATLNQNQQNVDNTLNNYFNGGGTLPLEFTNIFGLTGSSLANALTQIDGEEATGAQTSAFQLMNEFLALITGQSFGGGAGGNANLGGIASLLAYAPQEVAGLPPEIAPAYDSTLKAPAASPTFDQRWHVWGAGFGGGRFADGNAVVGSINITTTTYGYAGGMDYRPTPDTLYGFVLGGGGSNWGLANALGTGRSEAFQAGVYGRTNFGPAYVSGAFAFGNNWFSTRRSALGEQLTAKFQGQSYALRLEGGYRYALPADDGRTAIGVTPYAAVQTQWFHTPAYKETGGAFALAYNSQTANDTRTELGARFDNFTTFNSSPIVLRASLAWAHDFMSNPSLGAAFESLPGSNFTVNGAPIPHDSALATASAQWWLTPSLSLTAKFDGDFAATAQTYAGSATLRYRW